MRASLRAKVLAALLSTSTAAFSLATVSTVGAAPPLDPQAQATQLESQIFNNAMKLDGLNEQTKGAQLALDQANATIADAQARIASAKTQTDQLVKALRSRAASIYQSASNGGQNLGILSGLDVSTWMTSQRYAAAATAQDNTVVDQLNAARTQLSARERDAQATKQAAQAKQAALAAMQAQFAATQNSYQSLLNQVRTQSAQVQQLVAQATVQRNTGPAPTAPAPKVSTGAPASPTGGSPVFDPSKVPPASGKAGIAVAFAMAQVGKPYRYAAAGPDAYDCSGLTMASWAAAGVSLPHIAGSQYASIPHVPMNALQAGDLVFYGDMSHVALYAGGGMVVEATHTGDVIHYWPMQKQGWPPFVAAGRPG